MGTAAVVVDGATLGPVASSTGVTDVELVRGVGSEVDEPEVVGVGPEPVGSEVDDPEVVGVGDGPVEPDEPEPEDPWPSPLQVDTCYRRKG
ncbi:hypothetical protein Afer_1773 [Acidimicrobium ferrooxidans DSM 10331]|uniref:Uncharacterized protein n=1 Tax=Acidimicrobium ferrooxidans (strain DSM 10331 / JCM 15462 / NBRC 103882 / ICP) TaxID=525909 RepID=C7M139_ACIFD|nr:hypothetical protein Afer_1773 [Acidimicrobium ferrooxidans DSM 10331]